MDITNKKEIARLVRNGRIARGYTQQQLADLTRLSLRSVQRIENGEVLPRAYTLKILAEQLDLPAEQFYIANNKQAADAQGLMPMPEKQLSKSRKVILSTGSLLLIILLTAAFVSQSVRFPETNFEWFLLLGFDAALYSAVLFGVWK